MAVELINLGLIANDGTGDDLREAFRKVNNNFEELDLRQPEQTTASNLGSGAGIFAQKSGYDLKFKSLVQGDNITITSTDNALTISAVGGLQDLLISADGGSRWVAVDVQMPHKACVRFLDDSKVLAVGRTGVMLSEDRGESWKTVSNDSFYTFDVDQPSGTVFMAGAAGRVGRIKVHAIR